MIVGSANCRLMRTQRERWRKLNDGIFWHFPTRYQHAPTNSPPPRPYLVKVPNSRNILSYFAAKPQQQDGGTRPRTVCFIIEQMHPPHTPHTIHHTTHHTKAQHSQPSETVFESCIKYEIKKLTKIVKRKKTFQADKTRLVAPLRLRKADGGGGKPGSRAL